MSRSVVFITLLLILAAPAWAQRDTMRMGENLDAIVVRPPAPPGPKDVVNLGERLEQKKQPAALPASPPAERRQGQ